MINGGTEYPLTGRYDRCRIVRLSRRGEIVYQMPLLACMMKWLLPFTMLGSMLEIVFILIVDKGLLTKACFTQEGKDTKQSGENHNYKKNCKIHRIKAVHFVYGFYSMQQGVHQ